MSEKTISVIINLDTRTGFQNEITHQHEFASDQKMPGVRSTDFLIEGVENKIKFFDGYPIQVSLHIDVHNRIPQNIRDWIDDQLDCKRLANVTFFRHTDQINGGYDPHWNDYSYLNACALARTRYIAHFDADMAAFNNDPSLVQSWIDTIDRKDGIDWISYPSRWSPVAVDDASFDYRWVSTRFFFGRTAGIDRTEMIRCFYEDNLFKPPYVDRKRKNPWFEHVLGIVSNSRVFYPPIEMNRYMIFSWYNYRRGTYAALNQMSYGDKVNWVNSRGGISYPCDVNGE